MSTQKALSVDLKVRSGIELYESGKTNKAKRILVQCLEESPANFDALRILGFIAGQQNEYEIAAQYFQRAVDIQPTFVEGWYYLGKSFEQLGKPDYALSSFERAIQIFPNFFEAHHDRGLVQYRLKRYDDAIASFNIARSLSATSPEVWQNLGAVYVDKKNYRSAIECYERVVALVPTNFTALVALANTYSIMFLHQKAAQVYEKIFALKPDSEMVRGYIFNAKLFIAEWSNYEADKKMMIDETRAGMLCVSPFTAAAVFDSPELMLRVAKEFGRLCLRPPIGKHSETGARDKIVLAYLSADYYAHATSVLMLDVFKNHDRSKFEVIAISFGPVMISDATKEIRAAFDQFIDVKAMSDFEVARLLSDLNVDIAIDLKGYTFDSRPGILAYRPAPIQVNYLGYPGTMGVEYIDYLIADKFVIPASEDIHYAESIVTLPGCYQANGRNRPVVQTLALRADHGLPETAIVFCSFNSPYKHTPAMFDVWMNILKRIDKGVLWLLSGSPGFEENIRAEAIKRGVDANRIIFAEHVPLVEHLARLPLADLFLDSLPYGAHTTASDALWANVPVVTCVGRAFPGRVGQSVLEAMEMPELIAHSLPEYFDLACGLAGNEILRNETRKKIAGKVKTSRLFDAKRFTKELECAYAEMEQIRRAGKSPRKIVIPELNS
jgi:protein O-GlcNAc transferase